MPFPRLRREKTSLFWITTLALAALLASPTYATVIRSEINEERPVAREPGGASPSQILANRVVAEPPPLAGEGEDASRNVRAFIDWAAATTLEQEDAVRKTIVSAGDNPAIAEAFCREAFAAQKSDHSRALIVLSLLGEMRNQLNEGCLRRFLELPLPERGTVVEGEIIERTALEILQAKAIDGLAYLLSSSADQIVLDTVRNHPSRIVRAEAIAAYLWNRKGARAAQETLRSHVRRGEEIFLDRIVRESGESAETFNPKLDAFLKAHPELVPPPPEQERNNGNDPKRPEPPVF